MLRKEIGLEALNRIGVMVHRYKKAAGDSAWIENCFDDVHHSPMQNCR